MANEPDPNDDPPSRPSRRKSLTPELRRFLGPGRSWRDREAAKEQSAEAAERASTATNETETPRSDAPPSSQSSASPEWSTTPEPAAPPEPKPERRRTSPTTPTVVPNQKLSRALEMQTVALIIGGLILLGTVFLAGTKVRVMKAFFASMNKPQLANVDLKKFPGLSSDELVEQALAAERLGQWREAVERLLVAKRRNGLYRGLVFRAGRLCYNHGDFDGADRLLERAIAFGDRADTANYLRGLIAVGRNDLPAAEQFFQAAIAAEPFTPGYYYYLGDTLRREQRAKEAAIRYDQAATRTVNEQDALLCRFKARMARSETADYPQLQTELEQKRAAGPLSLDWMLTDAALQIRSGQFADAAQLIQQARPSFNPRLTALFASCTADMLFTDAAKKHPEIAAACQVGGSGSAPPSPEPFATP
jgi:tetratricopeptide (TPR) repeat protein